MPTWLGWVVIFGVLLLGVALATFTIHPFLALDNGQPGGALVVEGWATDDVLERAFAEFQTNRYDRLYVTGGPIEFGAMLSEYKTYAARGAAVLVKLGLEPARVQAVPAPAVLQDRTYASAVSLRKHLEQAGASTGRVHVFTEGAHARRSRLLFARAFGKGVTVTVTSVPTRAYDERRWWASSSGFRAVVGEVIAYAYVKVFFSP